MRRACARARMSVSLQLRVGGREGAFGVGRVHRRHAESKSEEDRPQPTLKCSLFVLFLMVFFPLLAYRTTLSIRAAAAAINLPPPTPPPPSLFLRVRKEGGEKKKGISGSRSNPPPHPLALEVVQRGEHYIDLPSSFVD